MIATLLALAIAQGQPVDLGEDLRWARSGTLQTGFVTYMDSTKTTALQCDGDTVAGAHTRPCCIPFRAQVVLKADKPITLCWSETATLTLGAYASEQAMVATDANPAESSLASGNGACLDIAAPGEVHDTVPDFATLAAKVGSRSYQGICTLQVTDHVVPGTLTFSLCRTTADCTNVGLGTCDTSIDAADKVKMQEFGCAYLVGRASAVSTRVTGRVER